MSGTDTVSYGRVGDDINAVYQPPEQVDFVGAMPQSADQENCEQVAVGGEFSMATAAKGDVDVISKPGRE